MTELQRRFAVAERDGAVGVETGEAREAVFRSVRRRRAVRGVSATAAVAFAIVGVTVAMNAIVDSHRPVPPAVQPQLVEASAVTVLKPGAIPPEIGAARMWSEVDDRWSLALLGASETPYGGQAIGKSALALVAPDGRTSTVAQFESPGQSQLLAWDPVFRTALLSTSP